MKAETRVILERPFGAEQIKQRQGNFGQVLDYIEGHAVIERLNEAFEGEWTFEVIWHEIREDEVLVKGRLIAGGIIKEQYGGSKVSKCKDTGAIISIGDDIKSAATDALKKCATLFGVGLHLYRNQNFSVGVVPKNQCVKSGGEKSNDGSDNGVDNVRDGNKNGGRATAKQLKYIFELARERDMTSKEIRDLCVERWGLLVDYISKAQASELIQELSKR